MNRGADFLFFAQHQCAQDGNSLDKRDQRRQEQRQQHRQKQIHAPHGEMEQLIHRPSQQHQQGVVQDVDAEAAAGHVPGEGGLLIQPPFSRAQHRDW